MDGYVTNLLIGVGDYAQPGTVIVSVIDSDSYWIDGYFEETKMARVCIGDRVEAKLMGYAQPILGHVATVTRGIGVSNAAAGVQGLPDVDPVYTWVRLAQRVPVRIAIDKVPPGVPLVAGMTATVTVLEPGDAVSGAGGRPWWRHSRPDFPMFSRVRPPGPTASRRSRPTAGGQKSLPVEVEEPDLSPEQINPGLAPGMSVSPRNR